jgi:excisionase family DNA binding protein
LAKRKPERTEELPSLLSVETTCRLIGISRSAGYRAAAAGGLPTLRLGRRVYVPTGHLLTLLGMTQDELLNRLARLRPDRPPLRSTA